MVTHPWYFPKFWTIQGIENQIVSYQGHVITEITLNENKKLLLDPDFGVKIDMTLAELNANPASVYPYYRDADYSEREALALARIYGTKHTVFDNVYAFMPKRYLFEYLSYVFKWLISVSLLLVSLIMFRNIKKDSGPPVNWNGKLSNDVKHLTNNKDTT